MRITNSMVIQSDSDKTRPNKKRKSKNLMRDFIDFIKYVIKYCYEQVYEQNIRDQEVYGHRDGRDPSARDTLVVVHLQTTHGVNVRREHLPV